MPKEIQNPGTSYALTDAAGLKGRFPMQLDEVAVAVYGMLQLDQTPYGRDAIPCIGRREQTAAGAGIYSSVGVQAAPGVILEVRKIALTNAALGVQRYDVAWVDAVGFGALWTSTGNSGLVDVSTRQARVSPASPFDLRVASQVHSLTRNVLLAANLTRIANTNATYVQVEFPYGVFLDGTRSDGPPALIVQCISANIGPTDVTFYCREFPPKG